jgi:DNA-binding response OmpR family regulator
VPKIVVAADAKWVRDQVRTALAGPGTEVFELTRGQDVRDTVGREKPDLCILDMQIGNMGGVAVTLDLHLEESAERLPPVKVLLLLDREADHFLAQRASVDAELTKPLDAGTLRRAIKRLLNPEETPITPLQSTAPAGT